MHHNMKNGEGDTVAHTCNPSIRETDTGELATCLGQLGLSKALVSPKKMNIRHQQGEERSATIIISLNLGEENTWGGDKKTNNRKLKVNLQDWM